jgi:hypothetical protein
LSWRQVWRNGLTSILGLGLGLSLVEILLRLVPGALPAEIQPQVTNKAWVIASASVPRFYVEYRRLWEEDPFLREHMKPGLDTVVHGNPEYPSWHIRTSSLDLGPAGFRDERPKEQPYAVVLGDSFGFGVGLRHEDVWLEQLERQTGLPFVNLSQVGASSIQQARIYTKYGRQLQASIVIWMFFQNDMKDNLRFAHWLDPTAGVELASRPPGRPCQSWLHRALKKYSLIYELLIYWQRNCDYAAILPTPVYRDGRLSVTFCLDHDICDPAVQARMLAAGWPLTQAAIHDTRQLVEQSGAVLVVLIVPSKEQVYWEQFQKVAGLPANYDVDQLVAPMRAYCAQAEIRCLDLTPVFRAEATSGAQLYFPVDIHWNERGQALVAQAVGDYLRETGLLP